MSEAAPLEVVIGQREYGLTWTGQVRSASGEVLPDPFSPPVSPVELCQAVKGALKICGVPYVSVEPHPEFYRAVVEFEFAPGLLTDEKSPVSVRNMRCTGAGIYVYSRVRARAFVVPSNAERFAFQMAYFYRYQEAVLEKCRQVLRWSDVEFAGGDMLQVTSNFTAEEVAANLGAPLDLVKAVSKSPGPTRKRRTYTVALPLRYATLKMRPRLNGSAYRGTVVM